MLSIDDKKFTSVTRLHRLDFAEYLPKRIYEKFTDEEMESFARRIEDAMMNTGVFWDVIQQISVEEKNDR